MTASKRAGCKEWEQESGTWMEDQEGPPQGWGARGRVSKAEAGREMALWFPDLAAPGQEMVTPRLALTFFEFAEGLLVLGWEKTEACFLDHLLPGAEEQGGCVCAGEEAHEMSQGLI